MAKTETTTTITKLDPMIAKHINKILSDAGVLYDTGKLGQVADIAGVQDALRQGQEFYGDVLSKGMGTGAMMRAMQGTQGNLLSQRQGALGSARAGRSMDAAMLDRELELRQADMQAKGQAAQSLAESMQAGRGLEQEVLDADKKAIESMSSIVAGMPRADSTQTTAPKQRSGGK